MAQEALPLVNGADRLLHVTFDFDADPIAVGIESAPYRPGQLDDSALACQVTPAAELLSRLRALTGAYRDAIQARTPTGATENTPLTLTLSIFVDGTFSVASTSRDGPPRKALVASAEPSWGRLFLALLVSPVPPILLFALYWRGDAEGSPGFVDGLFAGILRAVPSVLVLGIPLVLLLRGRVRPTLANGVLAGAVIASTPWWIAAALSGPGYLSTVTGLALPATALGCLGGAIFYLVGAHRFSAHRETRSRSPTPVA